MYVAILGRQPTLGIAELERLYGDVHWFSDNTAVVNAPVDLSRLGGSQKIGRVVATLPGHNWHKVSQKIIHDYSNNWHAVDHKITLGLSSYGFAVTGREVQKIGLSLKHNLKKSGVSLRLVPNDEAALSTATGHHNKLGLSDNKVELLIVLGANGSTIIAESIGTQNITAYAHRDQNRPKRDARVGMLPPKLAQIIINLAAPKASNQPQTMFDPFCGTGVVLQEAALMGYHVYGSDLEPRMVDYSRINLDWLQQTHHVTVHARLQPGDATKQTWQPPFNAVATETYLGQPFSAPPSPAKLAEVVGNCNHIISSFLQNIHQQLPAGTPLCVAVPAWRAADGSFTHLPLVAQLGSLGYSIVPLHTVRSNELLYYRESQIVARELLVLEAV